MKPWTITFDGHTWTDDRASTALTVAVTELIGDRWDAVSPWNGPRVLAAWITVLHCADTGGDVEQSLVKVYGLPVAELVAGLTDRAAA